jgi:3-keto-5-aminohexanoate cleavage enzyme
MESAEQAMREVMIMVAPNGARRTKVDHPALPLTPGELAEEARACAAAGATAIHLHVRDQDGRHTLDVERYQEAIAAVREATGPDFVIQVTTESVDRFSAWHQMACVRALRPPAVSIALREILSEPKARNQAIEFFHWLAGESISAQIILYDTADLHQLIRLVESGTLPLPPLMLFVLGRYRSDQQSSPDDLTPFLELCGDRSWPFAVCAFGRREAECMVYAARHGGHIRVGFENNLDLPDGRRASSNAELVGAVSKQLAELGIGLMDAASTRRLMALPNKDID